MSLVVGLFLAITTTNILIAGQGARGGGSLGIRVGGVHGGGAGGVGGSSSNSKDSSKKIGIILGSLFGGACAVCLLIYCCKPCLRRKTTRADKFSDNIAPEYNTPSAHNLFLFQSGSWSSRYFQHGRWQARYQLSLIFNPEIFRVNGSGSDDVGTFIILGIYSTKTQRMNLTKTYRKDTGNPAEIFGHKVTIQLIWNSRNSQFEGKWFVKTSNHYEKNKCEFKFEKLQQPPMNSTYNKF